MVLLRAVTVILAAVLTAMALRRVMGQLNAAKVRVNSKPSNTPRATTRLRQDPRTGIYYPEQ